MMRFDGTLCNRSREGKGVNDPWHPPRELDAEAGDDIGRRLQDGVDQKDPCVVAPRPEHRAVRDHEFVGTFVVDNPRVVLEAVS